MEEGQADRISDVHDYINVLRRRSDVFILFFITVVAVTAAGSFILTPVYRATTTILIDVESPNVLTTSGAVSLESQNYFSYKEYYQSQIEILTSETLVRRVFDEFNIGGFAEYQRAKEPLKKFMKTIKVESVRDTRLVKLNVENKDPELAARIANRLAELYVMRNLSYISKNEMLNLLKNEYLKLDTKLAEYTKVYKDDHPEMIRLKKELAELIAKIDLEKRSAITSDIGGDEEKSQYRNALEGLKANNISVLSLAAKPVLPVRPKKLLNIAVALIVGLFGGIAAAFFLDYLDDTVKDMEEIERMVTWPFLGNVPAIQMAGWSTEFKRDIFVHTKPKEPAAEAYRSIRTSLLFSSTEERPLRVMVVTSPGPQEGKTTTLCNLAIAMAQNKSRVLLVDADMRKSRLHDVFKKPNDKGLSAFLTGQAKLDELAQPTDIENLSLLVSGPHPLNPSELLMSAKAKELFDAARKKYDFVFIDTPPIAVLTDALIIGRVTDGIIMVFDSGKTSRRAIPRLDKFFADSKARIIGVIVNRLTPSSGDYYYNYYYGKVKSYTHQS